MKKKKVTAIQVTEHPMKVAILKAPVDEFNTHRKKEFHSAVHAVQQFLSRDGHHCGTKKAMHC